MATAVWLWLVSRNCEMGGGRCTRSAFCKKLPVLRCGEGGFAPIFLPFLNWKY